jgi:hypothetical protein
LKITEVANIFEPLFPTVKVLNLFARKMGLATFWATFSQTHRVTLPAADYVRAPSNLVLVFSVPCADGFKPSLSVAASKAENSKMVKLDFCFLLLVASTSHVLAGNFLQLIL